MTTLKSNSTSTTTFGQAFGFSGIDIPLTSLAPMGSGANSEINPNYVFNKDIVKQVLYSIKAEENLLLWGDAGSGKTDLIEQVAARLNRQSFIISFGEETSARQLIGGRTISSSAGTVEDDGKWGLKDALKKLFGLLSGFGTKTPFQDGALLRAIKTPFAVIGLDELNMAPAGVVAMLNHLLEEGEIIIPETGKTVKCAEGVSFLATSNTNMGVDETGLFEGSQNQNAATRSRFAGVHVKYLEEADELKLIELAYPELDQMIPPIHGRDYGSLTIQLANALRSAMRDGGLSLPFSVRQVHRFIKSSLAFQDPILAFKYSYWNLLDSVERQTAGDLFQTVFNLEVKD